MPPKVIPAAKNKNLPKGKGRRLPVHPKPSTLHIKMATKFALLGLDNPSIARALEIDLETYKRFMRESSPFRTAVNDGKITADAEIAESAYKQGQYGKVTEVRTHVDADGQVSETRTVKDYVPSSSATAFWLRNRQRAYWKDESTKNINVNEPVRLDDPRIIDVTDWSDEDRDDLERALLEHQAKEGK